MKDATSYVLLVEGISGINYELAKLFARDAFGLIIVSRNQAELENKAEEFRSMGIKVIPIQKDVFYRNDVFALYEEIRSKELRVDILINDAGEGIYSHFLDKDAFSDIKIIDFNISSLILLTNCFLMDMRMRGSGKILNIACFANKLPDSWFAFHRASRAFVLSFTCAIRERLDKNTGISVTGLIPINFNADTADMLNGIDCGSKLFFDHEQAALQAYESLMTGKQWVIIEPEKQNKKCATKKPRGRAH